MSCSPAFCSTSALALLLVAALRGPRPAAALLPSSWGSNSSAWWFGLGELGVPSWSTAGCTSFNTCSPTFCQLNYQNMSACTNSALQAGNTSNATYVKQLATVTGHTCSVAPQTQDARCTAAALAAVFGQYPGILAAYCNQEYLVVHSTVQPNHPTFLSSIPTPPQGAGGCVTRDYVQSWYYAKIPLRPTALSTGSGATNNYANFLYGANTTLSSGTNNMYITVGTNSPPSTLAGNINLPNGGPAGWALNGVPIFPSFPSGAWTWQSCEVDKCNAHAGAGFDYHYHGDPFGPQCMYSASNYANTSAHPPLIGYGADGYPIFGRHLSISAPGYNISLDECGGHSHSGMGDPYITDNSYHVRLIPPAGWESMSSDPSSPQYHTWLLNSTVTNPKLKDALNAQPGVQGTAPGTWTYTNYAGGPFLCWKGDISKNTNFWSPNFAPYSMGDLSSHSDLYQIQPCTSSGVYVNSAIGISVNVTRTSLASSGTSVSTSLTASLGSSSSSGRRLLERLLLQSSAALPGFIASETPPEVLPGIPPGFIQNFPNTVAQFLGLQNASFITITSVNKQLNASGMLTGLTINYLITTPDVATSQQLVASLNLLPANPSFVAALASKFPGVTAATIGASTILVNGASLSNGTASSTPALGAAAAATAVAAATGALAWSLALLA